MIGFDFALPLRGTGLDRIAVDAELGEALAEGGGLERRALVELEAIGEPPHRAGALEHGDGRFGGWGVGEVAGECEARVVIEDGERMHGLAPEGFEAHPERALGVELPALVGMERFVAVAVGRFVTAAQPFDAAVGGVGLEVAVECGAA